ncbi:creatininase family protein [Streptomyces sp. NPDC001339]|uniref:creatininase family protein n=1 Tax=Streptomyces sp. NPDC001339 TaxID=3364563 RepID=UPI00368016AF
MDGSWIRTFCASWTAERPDSVGVVGKFASCLITVGAILPVCRDRARRGHTTPSAAQRYGPRSSGPEVEAAAGRGACVLLPTGVIEQHGPHLPLGTDAYGAYQLAALAFTQLRSGPPCPPCPHPVLMGCHVQPRRPGSAPAAEA